MVPAAGNSPEAGFLIGEVLQDHRAFGQDLAVVQLQGRDLVLAIEVDSIVPSGALRSALRSSGASSRSMPASREAMWEACEQAPGQI